MATKPMTFQLTIRVADKFSTPGARKRDEGPHSGQEFREDYLEPAFEHAVQEDRLVHIDLDGCAGFPTSFLEEAFGGLARKYSPTEVLKRLQFTSNDEPLLVDEIAKYIREAKG